MRRRELIRGVGAFALIGGGGCSGCEEVDTGPLPDPHQTESVTVIGAGMAGLAAARRLRREGYETVVLEARDRIGGRVWTFDGLGAPIDFGASWIHGTDGNPMMELAEELGVTTRPTDYDSPRLWDHDGRQLSADEVHEINTEFFALLGEVEASAEDLESDVSIERGFERALEGETLTAFEERAMAWRAETVEVASAADFAEMSLGNGDDDEGLEGGDRLFPGGYHQLVASVAEGLDVRLERPVTLIRYGDEGVQVSAGGERFEADAVICTIPLGVLQAASSVRFVPPLAPDKRRALRQLRMGTLNKLGMRFAEAFWPSDVEFFGYMPDDEPWMPVFLNFQHHAQQPILMGFTGGSAARAMSRMSDEAATGRAMGILREMFGDDIPDPVQVYMSRWDRDRWSRGSYSYVPTGGDAAARRVLASPPHWRLHFAGEHTSHDHPSTVHGAYWSGIRAAEELLTS